MMISNDCVGDVASSSSIAILGTLHYFAFSFVSFPPDQAVPESSGVGSSLSVPGVVVKGGGGGVSFSPPTPQNQLSACTLWHLPVLSGLASDIYSVS